MMISCKLFSQEDDYKNVEPMPRTIDEVIGCYSASFCESCKSFSFISAPILFKINLRYPILESDEGIYFDTVFVESQQSGKSILLEGCDSFPNVSFEAAFEISLNGKIYYTADLQGNRYTQTIILDENDNFFIIPCRRVNFFGDFNGDGYFDFIDYEGENDSIWYCYSLIDGKYIKNKDLCLYVKKLKRDGALTSYLFDVKKSKWFFPLE
jgi:hypothetical protein